MSKKLQFIFGGIIMLSILIALSIKKIFKENHIKYPVEKIEITKSELVAPIKTDTLMFTSGIRAIFQDSKGNYWFGSNNEGVCCYNGKVFVYFTTNNGLQDNQIRSIQEDANGTIWFGTQNGVSSYNGKTIINHTANENSVNEWQITETDLWFDAGTKQGIIRYNGEALHYLPFPIPKDNHTGSVYAVTSVSKGKNNRLWIGTYAGFFGYNGIEFNIYNDETLGFSNTDNGVHVRSVLEDSKGRLWIGNNGIGVILKNGDAISNFSKQQGKLLPMEVFEANIKSNQAAKNTGLQAVFAIEEDGEGNIWFGDRDSGAWKYDGKTLTNYRVNSALATPMIWSIYKDQANNLLFGMAAGGIYKFNGATFTKQF